MNRSWPLRLYALVFPFLFMADGFLIAMRHPFYGMIAFIAGSIFAEDWHERCTKWESK